MSKTEAKTQATFTISQAIPHFGLNSSEKFVCLRVFDAMEKHTLADWEKLIEQKKIK